MKQKNKSRLRRWYELSKPNKKLLTVQFVTCVFHSISHIIAPICAAYVISSLYNAVGGTGSFATVYFWLAMGLLNLFLRQIVGHINYLAYPRLMKSTYLHIQDKIFNKVLSAKEQGLKQMSLEKLVNIVNTDINEAAILGDLIVTKSVWLLRVLSFVVLTFIINPLAGVIGIFMIAANCLMIGIISIKLGHARENGLVIKDRIVEHFSEVVRARNLAKDYGLTQSLKQDYMNHNIEYFKNRDKYYFLLSMRDNWIYCAWNVLIVFSSVFLVYLVYRSSISVEQYLIVTSYLLSGVTLSADALNVFIDIANVDVSVMRINTLLSFEDKELIELGKSTGSEVYGEIMFNNVNFNGEHDGEIIGKLNNVTLTFPKNTLSIIHGPHQCGKRALFYMLRRKVKAQSGVVTVNGIEVSEYSEKAYKNIVNFSNYDPYFFKGSIIKNFLSVNNDKKQIYKICEMLKIKNYIEALPNGFNTDVAEAENFDVYKKFLMGFASALLTNSRFILIYGVPLMLSNEEKAQFIEILKKFKKVRTIIMIMPDNKFAEAADKVYNLVDGALK